ncbi:hypothetical protein [Persicirhabdus sediminis]|uniref:EcsC protein family protein n=1 Tax=Persicirhabdus sediminis TaxID=454144 RepID=A0A8J7MJ86_9BACT|nr:hypothetical protein [Persicirhabdus sediminis]MBK1792013.1 hypothetical protein [Persicirhabdus sediminis]
MEFGFWDFVIWALIACAVVWVILFVLMVVAFFWFKNWLGRVLLGDAEALEARYTKLLGGGVDADAAVRQVIRQEAKISGVLGFVTGFGGLLTLPVALPLDVFGSIRIQTRLVEFLARRRGGIETDTENFKLQQFAIISGVQSAGKFGAKAALKLVMRYSPKLLLQAIPVIGGVIGYAVDYSSTRALGYGLYERYLQKPPSLPPAMPAQLE